MGENKIIPAVVRNETISGREIDARLPFLFRHLLLNAHQSFSNAHGPLHYIKRSLSKCGIPAAKPVNDPNPRPFRNSLTNIRSNFVHRYYASASSLLPRASLNWNESDDAIVVGCWLTAPVPV